ncbi:SNF2 family DNA-dependent ATPase domain-containing protein, partial [Aureobasidium melanogenum]
MSATRLDRLVVLLDTGSTQLIRNTAAQQLADVQKNHPDELFNLLTRVVPFLRSSSWDTRTAAAKALGGIVEHAPKFDPNEEDVKNENGDVKKEENGSSAPLASEDQLQLATLDVEAILTNGKELLGSAGRQYDFKLAGMDPAQRLAHQKKTLTNRLGLGGEYMEDELVTETDIAVRPNLPPPAMPTADSSMSRANSVSESAVVSPSDQQTPSEAMSKRQLNMLKRRRKEELKRDNKKFKYDLTSMRRESTTVPTPADSDTIIKDENGETNASVPDYFSLERKGGDDDAKVVSEFKGAPIVEKSAFQTEVEETGNGWPFERLCEFLTVDLFDPAWEIRHGAAMGLREIVRVHGAGAGRLLTKTKSENDRLNQAWLDDLACRICCVFMLDRFADYVSDNAIAPIRETAGQTLGALLQYLPASSVHAVNRILYRLVMQKDLKVNKRIWHACHGGMIGMRYLVAVRNDLLLQDNLLMDGVLECVIKGLGDNDDDVRAVSAATLIPVAKEFVNMRHSALNHLISVVWECLSNLSDDLSASTGSVMDLLAKLCGFPEVLDAMKKNAAENPEQSFAELVPRLYPFLRHTISTVRSAVLRALLTFVNIEGDDAKSWVDGRALRLVFQNLLVERNETVLKLSLQVWYALVDVLAVRPEKFATEFEPHLAPLVTLTFHPIGVSRHPIPMDATLFIRPSGYSYAPLSSATRKSSPVNGSSEPARKRRR